MTDHDVSELLPFYANGTLSAPDRARVEAELASCAACAAELRDLRALAASLRDRADDAPAIPDRIFDRTMERIASGPVGTVTALRTAWWGAPARFATAAALVVGVGAAAVAAYHAHEADFSRSGPNVDAVATIAGGAVYRVTPAPRDAKVAASRAPHAPSRAVDAMLPNAAARNAAPAAQQHRLAKKARIAVLVRDVETSLKGAQTTIRDVGGDVTSMADETPRSADVVHGATLDAEVPADRLESTLDRLGALGAVQNRAIDAEDVADAIVDEEARLRNLRREETDLRALMDKGGKVGDVLDVQEHLSDVRGQIEQLAAQHQHDVHRVATSTISLALTEDRPNGAPAKPGPTARIDGAWHDGVNALGDALTTLLAAIVWCVAFAPLPLAASAATYTIVRIAQKKSTAPA